VRRIKKVSSKFRVDKNNMQRNFKRAQEKIIAEPLYILLASLGHSNAHEYVRKLVIESLKVNRPLAEIVIEDENLKPYLENFTGSQREIISDPSKYIGIASRKTEEIVKLWEEQFRANS